MKLKNILAIMMVVFIILSISATAFAAESIIDNTKRGSISITLAESNAPHNIVYGASFKLYRVAAVKTDNENRNISYELSSTFSGCGVDLTNIRQEDNAEHLATFAETNKINSVIAYADENGKVLFSDLELGLYLVVQNGSVSGYYQTDPFIVSVPMTNAEGTEWDYDIDASPKVQTKPVTPPTSTTTLTVIKQWIGYGEKKETSIKVDLLCDGVAVQQVTLNAGNNWTYTWRGLSKSSRWSVAEVDVPEGYQVSYSVSGTTTTITNTYEPDLPDNPESLTVKKVWEGREAGSYPSSATVELWNGNTLYSKVELNSKNEWTYTWSNLPKSTEWSIKEVPIPENYEAYYTVSGTTITIRNKYNEPNKPPIIQTGELNWPIPVLSCGGLVLIALGCMLIRKKRKKDTDA